MCGPAHGLDYTCRCQSGYEIHTIDAVCVCDGCAVCNVCVVPDVRAWVGVCMRVAHVIDVMQCNVFYVEPHHDVKFYTMPLMTLKCNIAQHKNAMSCDTM